MNDPPPKNKKRKKKKKKMLYPSFLQQTKHFVIYSFLSLDLTFEFILRIQIESDIQIYKDRYDKEQYKRKEE